MVSGKTFFIDVFVTDVRRRAGKKGKADKCNNYTVIWKNLGYGVTIDVVVTVGQGAAEDDISQQRH